MRDRVRDGHWDVCVVVDQQHVVLGLVQAETLGTHAGTPVEEVMQPDPVTFRPNLAVGDMPDYLKTRRIPRALVTTSDGVLIGLLRIDDVERRPGQAGD